MRICNTFLSVAILVMFVGGNVKAQNNFKATTSGGAVAVELTMAYDKLSPIDLDRIAMSWIDNEQSVLNGIFRKMASRGVEIGVAERVRATCSMMEVVRQKLLLVEYTGSRAGVQESLKNARSTAEEISCIGQNLRSISLEEVEFRDRALAAALAKLSLSLLAQKI